MTTIYKFKAAFTLNGSAKAPSPAPTCTVVDTSDNLLVNAQPVTTLTNLVGVCLYSYSGADGLDLIGKFVTTDAAVDCMTLYSYTADVITTNVNATISSRSSHSVADIWNALTSGLTTISSIGKLLVDNITASILAVKTKTDNLPTDPADQSAVEAAITAAAAAIRGADNDTLKTLSDQIDTIDTNGAGSISTTITVNDGINPIDGVDVWISTDSAGTNVVARGSTGALGTVTFWLDAGTYYAWKQLAGYDFTNPQSFTVS